MAKRQRWLINPQHCEIDAAHAFRERTSTYTPPSRAMSAHVGAPGFYEITCETLEDAARCSAFQVISPISRHYRIPNARPNCLLKRSNVLRDGSSRLSKPWASRYLSMRF